jgi:hypothetical protein
MMANQGGPVTRGRSSLPLLLSVVLLLAAACGRGAGPTSATPARPAATAPGDRVASRAAQPASDEERQRYAERERKAAELADFEGGRRGGGSIPVTTVIVVLLVVILVLIIV